MDFLLITWESLTLIQGMFLLLIIIETSKNYSIAKRLPRTGVALLSISIIALWSFLSSLEWFYNGPKVNRERIVAFLAILLVIGVLSFVNSMLLAPIKLSEFTLSYSLYMLVGIIVGLLLSDIVYPQESPHVWLYSSDESEIWKFSYLLMILASLFLFIFLGIMFSFYSMYYKVRTRIDPKTLKFLIFGETTVAVGAVLYIFSGFRLNILPLNAWPIFACVARTLISGGTYVVLRVTVKSPHLVNPYVLRAFNAWCEGDISVAFYEFSTGGPRLLHWRSRKIIPNTPEEEEQLLMFGIKVMTFVAGGSEYDEGTAVLTLQKPFEGVGLVLTGWAKTTQESDPRFKGKPYVSIVITTTLENSWIFYKPSSWRNKKQEFLEKYSIEQINEHPELLDKFVEEALICVFYEWPHLLKF